MKKVFAFYFIIASLLVHGQNQFYFANPDVTWNVASTYPHANPQYPNFIETTTKVFGYSGDTIIGTDQWLKIFSSPDSSFSSSLRYLGIIKEIDGIVYYMDTINSIHTIYNFNLNPGDSVLYNFEFGDYYLVIETIDSILINGDYYKRFHFTEPLFFPLYLNEIWIEEIGSIHGPLFPANPRMFQTEIPDSISLTCFKKNGSVLWMSPNFQDCFINIILGLNRLTNSSFRIFPNPVSSTLNIDFQNRLIFSKNISIFDFSGKKIQCPVSDKINSIEIDFSSIVSGIYILQINIGETLYREKLIKQ